MLANKISSISNKKNTCQKDELISRCKDVAEIFDKSFVNVASNLGIAIDNRRFERSQLFLSFQKPSTGVVNSTVFRF